MIVVRPGTGLDEDAALALWQADLAQRGRRGGGPRAQRFRTLLRGRETLLLVAERAGRPVGVLAASVRDDDGQAVPGLLHLQALAGEQGAPRALLRALLQRVPRLSAWVPDEDDDVRGALELSGLAPTGRVRDGEQHWETPVPQA